MSDPNQQIKKIAISKLVLWSENPRDPAEKGTEKEILDQAFKDSFEKWNLQKLITEMGRRYDLSLLPIVVYKDNIPIVYDGNRRILLAKIKHKKVKTPKNYTIKGLDAIEIPTSLPCNVCTLDTALELIENKHSASGSWDTLARDYFSARHRGKPESIFIQLNTLFDGIIEKHKELNQRFVKEELFTEVKLKKIGIIINENGKILIDTTAKPLYTKIFQELISNIKNKTISTRSNRGEIFDAFSIDLKQEIQAYQEKCNQANFAHDWGEPSNSITESGSSNENKSNTQNQPEKTSTPTSASTKTDTLKKTPRQKEKDYELFTPSLSLKPGNVNNLYRDIDSLYQLYVQNKEKFTSGAIVIFRGSLRLLAETASKDLKKTDLKTYLNDYFNTAKAAMKNSTDNKTVLANNQINGVQALLQLLHTGAHTYTDSKSIDKLHAIALILGALIQKSHGKN